MEAWHTHDESNLVRHVPLLALASLVAGCAASRDLVITRDATSVRVAVDADQLPSNDEARTQKLVALAAKACRSSGTDDVMVISQRLVTRDEVQLDVDRVWASFQKNGPPSAWAQAPNSPPGINSRSTIPVSTALSQPDERSVHVQVPVWELSIECRG